MLDLLTKSRYRKRIIILFIYNQNKEYYLSEIAKHIKTSPGTTQREINRLIKIDLITMRKIGVLNVYKLNEKFHLLKEIESIVKKTIGIEIELKALSNQIENVTFSFIFGSYAKGEIKSESDIDIFFIGKPSEDDVYKSIKKVENLSKKEINYHISSEQEFIKNSASNYFYKDILKDYILIKGSEDDFREFIKEIA